ncbi:MAG TPA: hypothetical protein VL961_08840 [Acidimicrobiales bacterium]|nr:hypothetical protein [Acidimicrobiales bacterium]
MPWWASRSLADARRESLAGEFRAAKVRADVRASMRSAPVAPRRPVETASMKAVPTLEETAGTGRFAIGRHVGGLLIRAGVKMGGASGSLHAPELLVRR